jgi:hypothetical protein
MNAGSGAAYRASAIAARAPSASCPAPVASRGGMIAPQDVASDHSAILASASGERAGGGQGAAAFQDREALAERSVQVGPMADGIAFAGVVRSRAGRLRIRTRP